MQTLYSNTFANTATSLGDSLIFRSNYQSVRIKTDEILYIQALADYVIIKTTSAKYITLSTMKDMARLLEGRGFARTHRSYIVNMDKIHNIKGSNIIVHSDSNKMTIPVGRAFKKDFRQSLAA
jgi:DNA-binding LytR/AlgR family response regulator